MSLTLESPAFSSNALIPNDYTCTGKDLSPPLVWHDTASDIKSYALIVDDPDAPGGVWDHWILVNIPSNIKKIEAGTELPPGAVNGVNSWGDKGYRGPCPQTGTHRYFFRLYALDTILNVSDSVTKTELIQAMKDHIIDSGELIGLYHK